MVDILAYMRFKLERKFTAEQVLWAYDQYTDRKDDVPTPADIINILDPVKPRITESEFVSAQKWQENNGNPRYSSARTLIDAYEEQQGSARGDFKMPDEFLKIAANAVKRIG